MDISKDLPLKGAALALTIVALWGLHIVVIRIGALEVPPLFLLSIRFGLAFLIFAPFMDRIDRKTALNLFYYAFPYVVLHLGTLFVAMRNIDSGLAGLILQTEIPFAIVLAWLFLGERFGLKTLLGLLIAFSGVLLIIYEPIGNFSYLSAALCLTSAFFWAVGSIRMRYIKDVNFVTMTAFAYGIAFPFVAVLSYLIEDNQMEELYASNHVVLGLVIAYQVILMSLCLFGWKHLMSRYSVYKVTAFTLLQPIFSVAFGILLLGESLGTNTVIGGALTLTGVSVVTLRKIKRSEKQNASA